ncbi:unnamed protein product [Mortierella alpina]
MQARGNSTPAPGEDEEVRIQAVQGEHECSGETPVPDETALKVRPKPLPKTLATRSSSKSQKLAIKRQLAYHHPVSSLDVGTLQGNVRRVSADSSNLHSQIVRCIRDAVCDAASVKRRGQRIIGRFIEHAGRMGPQPDGDDRVFLDLLCPQVTKKDAEDHKDSNGEGGDTAKLNLMIWVQQPLRAITTRSS